VPPSVFVFPVSSIVPVALLVMVSPPWMIALFSCKFDAPVSVTVPPFTVVFTSWSVLPFAEIVPPVLLMAVFNSCIVPPLVASKVPEFVMPGDTEKPIGLDA